MKKERIVGYLLMAPFFIGMFLCLILIIAIKPEIVGFFLLFGMAFFGAYLVGKYEE